MTSSYANRAVNHVSFGDAMRFANWLHNGQKTGAQDASTTENGAYSLNGATTNAQLQAVSRNTATWKWAVTSEDEWYKAAYYDPNKSATGVGGYWDFQTKSNTMSTVKANYLDTSVGHATDVGMYPFASTYGTFDQGGNLWEWNEAKAINAQYRGLRGGSFNYPATPYMQSSYRSGDPAENAWVFVGFRVVENPATAVPIPAAALTGGILMMGVVALRRIRRY